MYYTLQNLEQVSTSDVSSIAANYSLSFFHVSMNNLNSLNEKSIILSIDIL